MATRIVTAIIAAAILLLLVYMHGIPLIAACVLVSLIVQYEIMRTIKKGGTKMIDIMGYLFAVFILPAYYFGGLLYVFILQMIAIVLTFVIGIASDRYNFDSIVYTVFTMYYPQLFFVFLYMIILVGDKSLSQYMFLITFAGTILTDTFAYFVGKTIGKHKLCPNISPNKTIEGAIGGLIGGVAGVIAFALILGKGEIAIYWYILLGVIVSVIGQFGDLAASVVKRRFGVKDFGNLIPGHGGLMDRVDSLLFNLPIVYTFFYIFGQIPR